MPVMLERWNGEKVDAPDARVERLDSRVERLDSRVERLETDVAALSVKLDDQRREMKAGFERVDDKFDRLNRTLLTIGGGVITTLIAALAAALAAPHVL